MKESEAIRKSKIFEELLDIQYGKIGTGRRESFEIKAKYFIISESLKAARREAKLTQEQLAEKAGTKKSYISRLENGIAIFGFPHFTEYLKKVFVKRSALL